MRSIWPEGVYYAKPRNVSDLSECYFYHTMEIPGYGLVDGEWDLRPGIGEYTGGVDFQGKRVLEIGTASGFVCFWMEQQGAQVVACDLSEKQSWDLVPSPTLEKEHEASLRRSRITAINNGYWLAHKAFASNASVVYGTVYDLPGAIGPVDVSTFCSVLSHIRDPFTALVNAARLTRNTILVTDLVSPSRGADALVAADLPVMEFQPDFREGGPMDSWWYLTPAVVVSLLGVLGFGNSEVSRHVQQSKWGHKPMFTVVAHRTVGTAFTS